MALDTGTKLGPYEIVEPIGAGGMGEVYRAQDSRLDRSVAIKVLPPHLSSNADVRARFEREARAVSSLNHPNICVLHDIGTDSGIDFLVMEYLEGETLASRLEKGPLPLAELLQVATQIADALDKAHRQGLIHRDLKPGNIMLTKSGAKLLDFGLARATDAGASETDLTQSPTLSRPLTAEGAIVGTFQYMAPEQLEGREADARTDIFAFGAVLYEMATGTRAFAGRTQASLIAAILKEEPRSIAELQPMTPPALERIVERCLSKDPDDRWQTARDLSLELQWIRNAGSQAGVPAPVRMKRKSRERLAWTVAVVFGLAATALTLPLLLRDGQSPEVMRFSLMPPEQTTVAFSQPMNQVSPDGRLVVLTATDSSGTSELWVRPIAARDARRLEGTENAILPFWSADSRSIGYFSPDGKLMRVSAMGGSPQVVCDAPSGRGGAWNRDDVILFAASSGGPLFRVSANGGAVTQVTALDSTLREEAHRFPQFLPDEKHFLYVSLPVREDGFTTYVGDLESAERKPVITAGGAAVYAAPGFILFARDQSLVAQRFDTGSLQVTGSPQLIGEDPGDPGAWTGAPRVSASTNGILVRAQGGARRTELVWFDRSGRPQGSIPLEDGLYGQPAFSRDERFVVVPRWNVGAANEADLWKIDLRRGLSTRFTFSASNNYTPVWSPDDTRVVFTSDREGNENLFIKRADGTGEEEPLLDSSALFVSAHDWSPDGKYIIYHTLVKETGFDLWLLPMTGDRTPRPFLVTKFNETDAAISPDGKWVAYRSDESGTWELYVQSFPDGGNKYRISTSGCGTYGSGFVTGWSPDGTEIVYAGNVRGIIMAAAVRTEPAFAADTPQRLLKIPPSTVTAEMAPNGRRILASVPPAESAQSRLSVVVNWTAALENR